MNKTLMEQFCSKLYKHYIFIMLIVIAAFLLSTPAFAVEDMWAAADKIIKDVYGKIAGISTVLAGLASYGSAAVGAAMLTRYI